MNLSPLKKTSCTKTKWPNAMVFQLNGGQPHSPLVKQMIHIKDLNLHDHLASSQQTLKYYFHINLQTYPLIHW